MREQINLVDYLKPQSRQCIDEYNDEGIFWMPYEEFLRYFSEFYVCRVDAHQTKVLDGSFFINQSITAFCLKVNQESRFDIQLYQTNQIEEIEEISTFYPIISPVIVKLNDTSDSFNFDLENTEHISFAFKKNICVNAVLTPGHYLVLPIMFQNLIPVTNSELVKQIKNFRSKPNNDYNKYKLVIQNSLKNKGSFEMKEKRDFNKKYLRNLLFDLCKKTNNKSQGKQTIYEYKDNIDATTVGGELFIFESVHDNFILVTAHNKHPVKYLEIVTKVTNFKNIKNYGVENKLDSENSETGEVNWYSTRKKFQIKDLIPPMKKKVIALFMPKKRENLIYPTIDCYHKFLVENETSFNSYSPIDLHSPFD